MFDEMGIVAYQFNRTRGSAVIWQLVSRNNRVLGVSPVDFANITAAANAAATVREKVTTALVDVTQEPGLQWRWSIATGEGEVLAVGGRAYGRRTDCQDAVRRFVDEASRADIDPEQGRRGRFWRAHWGPASE